ncbi:TetR/AcrR family transcriptional regulator [Amycolatopsis sp. cmx-4-68]|uniref:TetR/AcrR family transcriptional regulator n=1 Tax=Amycolatopsis sp. cmx-4-68 TaxID=2790938 RepID=UPI00397834E5
MPHVPASVRRPQVVEAAIALMAERGVGNVSTRDVAHAAGIPQATVHYLFGTREELLRAIIETLTDAVCQRILGSTGSSGDVEEVLGEVVGALVGGVTDDPQRHLLLLELTVHALRQPGLRDLAQWQYGRYEEASLLVLDQICRQTQTEFRAPPVVAVRFVLAVLDGFTVQQLVHAEAKSALAGLESLAGSATALFVPLKTR